MLYSIKFCPFNFFEQSVQKQAMEKDKKQNNLINYVYCWI